MKKEEGRAGEGKRYMRSGSLQLSKEQLSTLRTDTVRSSPMRSGHFGIVHISLNFSRSFYGEKDTFIVSLSAGTFYYVRNLWCCTPCGCCITENPEAVDTCPDSKNCPNTLPHLVYSKIAYQQPCASPQPRLSGCQGVLSETLLLLCMRRFANIPSCAYSANDRHSVL